MSRPSPRSQSVRAAARTVAVTTSSIIQSSIPVHTNPHITTTTTATALAADIAAH